MNENDRDQLKKQIEESKPFALIDEHSDEQIHKYFGLTKDAKYSTYEELFAMHSDAIVKLAAKDFELFRAVLTSHRCKTFLKKVEKMGFVPGYADSDINAPNGTHISESEEVVPRKKTKPEGEKRFPVTYGDDEIRLPQVFSDIYYDVYDPHAASMNIVLDRCDKSSKEGDCVEKADVLVTAQEPTSNSYSSPNDAHIDISFAFNPDKEPHLVAKNAFQYYRDDQEIIKYWYQRYRLFSKLDNGVIMDREGWFSVTPERIAEHIADRVVRRSEIIFAILNRILYLLDSKSNEKNRNFVEVVMLTVTLSVIAIDMDPVRLKCARENAKVYGVEDRIEFICCDFFHFASKWTENVGKTVQIDAVFLSPPWGGPSYLKSKVFDLDDLTPNGFDIYTAARKMSPNIAYFLPRSTSVKQLISLSGPGGRCEIEQSCLNKKIKALTIYYGDLAVQRGE
ncbi:RNA cap guanine-N2 methyltransferase [Necator americanus]|uniref:Trimethylguanosine synthase n=1 Tax=Necator americanus TaxID=51031 RepID=W2SHN0_NECAM|nr:RNA cap guanine-N2 methyltransferase [Necator americanus]ETN69159.1 RNA cap guanine-N2 methyltransferase [Necator americanus]